MKNRSGFTIVETMLALAIAGLILLIVFEAIPTLTRNSRNNQRKQDVQSILETISHYELNNSGDVPTTPELQASLTSAPKLTYYDVPSVTVTFSGLDTTSPIAPNALNLDQVQIYNHAKCDPNNLGQATNLTAGYNDVVALYSVESGSATNPQCQQL
jgi:prepilin-type N-terminal cleavage/methylation domain-containing protein